MDISVSRLNNRMALQVPGELPLGLVFIVGRVESLGSPAEGVVRFELVDAGYRLRCRLPAAVAEESLLKERDRVRASGHLAFDPHSAQYQLLARDIEILAAHAPGRETAQSAGLQDAGKETATVPQPQANAASLVPTELPPWVRKLAPPEVKEELGLIQEGQEPELPPEIGIVAEEGQTAAERTTELPPEMVSFLSSAIDSDEEIELTPEMIAEYLPEVTRRSEGVSEGQATGEGTEEETAPDEPVVEDVAGAAADERDEEKAYAGEEADAGDRAAERVPTLPQISADAKEKEAAESPGSAALTPPQRAPRREHVHQPQTRPARQYLEYAVIVLLVLLIMAALFVVVLLLLT